MKKKILASLLPMSLALLLVACGGNKSEDVSSEEAGEVKQEEEVKEPTDLSGTWKAEESDGSWMEATIIEDTISIDWVSDNGDTKSIYWIGTYTAPTEYVEEYSWTSERDKEKTDSALLASMDDTKEFSYSGGKIYYELSIMGTTTKVELEKE